MDIGLTLADITAWLYFDRLLNLMAIVSHSLLVLGSVVGVLQTSDGTFTTFPLIFNCFPTEASNNLMNAILGESILYSAVLRVGRCGGMKGNCKPIFIAERGTLPWRK